MGILMSLLRSSNTARVDPYPMHALKRVNRPTIRIDEERIHRVDGRDSGFNRAFRGEFGPFLQKERQRLIAKQPLSKAFSNMQAHLSSMAENMVAANRAPLPDDPALITRHIKETAYFLRADLVGVCKLPPYAVLSHDLGK
ncbi:MAG: hypothetical protein JRJ29_19020, partial [Deltaproteobacteria bacterium]|nr:hypothetical protein [Deltaproteobacteria bacterium]